MRDEDTAKSLREQWEAASERGFGVRTDPYWAANVAAEEVSRVAESFRTRNLAERLYIERLRECARNDATMPRRFAEENAFAAIAEARIFAEVWAEMEVRDGE